MPQYYFVLNKVHLYAKIVKIAAFDKFWQLKFSKMYLPPGQGSVHIAASNTTTDP